MSGRSAWAGAGRSRRRIGRVGRYLVTAGDGAVARYFLRHLYVPHGPRARLRRRLLPWLPAPARDRLLFEPDDEAGRLDVDRVLDVVREHASILLRGTPAEAGALDRLIVAGDARAHGRERTVLFVFHGLDPRPVAVVRVRARAAPGRSLAGQWAALRHLRGRDARLAASLPEPIAFLATEEAEILTTSVLDGRSVYSEVRSALAPGRLVTGHFTQAAEWLAMFHTVTRRSASLPRLAGEATDAVERAGSGGPVTGPVESSLRELEENGHEPPRAAAHGDFWAHNLLVARTGETCGVVDWEHYSEDALCAGDLFDFPLTYGLHYRWASRTPAAATFRATFLEPGPVSRAVRGYFGIYCDATGLDPAALRPLLQLHLVLRSATRPQMLARASGEASPWSELHGMLAAAKRPAFVP